MTSMWWAFLGGCLMAVSVFTLLVRYVLANTPNASGLPAAKSRSCQKCVHWNFDEGQRSMRKQAAFWGAAQNLSPNAMSRGGVDAEGNPKPSNKRLPQIEDRWEFFGACLKRGEIRHRTDTCELFRSPLTAHMFGPGEDYVAPAPPIAPVAFADSKDAAP